MYCEFDSKCQFIYLGVILNCSCSRFEFILYWGSSIKDVLAKTDSPPLATCPTFFVWKTPPPRPRTSDPYCAKNVRNATYFAIRTTVDGEVGVSSESEIQNISSKSSEIDAVFKGRPSPSPSAVLHFWFNPPPGPDVFDGWPLVGYISRASDYVQLNKLVFAFPLRFFCLILP